MTRRPGTGQPFPRLSLPDLEGAERPFVTAWAEGPALFLFGHRDCATTRLALPFVDRIHRRRPSGGSVLAVLQDEPSSARELCRDLDLSLPVLLESDPYPVSAEVGLRTVPTLLLVSTAGTIARVAEGFRRDHLETMAARFGVSGPLFSDADAGVPPRRPG